MNYFVNLLVGLGLGWIGSIGLGPVTLLVVNRSLHKGWASGYLSGMGASVSDTLYASVAAFGITLLINIIQEYSGWFRLLIAVTLFLIGLFLIFSKPRQNGVHGPSSSKNLWRDFATTLLLSLSNPIMVVVYLGLFGFFNIISEPGTPVRILFLLTGILLGANAYWFTLAHLIHRLRVRLKADFLRKVNLVIGLSMWVMAVIAGFKAWFSLMH
ncbi:MAG: LysE family transporter [Bacteroidales bacterium]|nr:LysE family transporter [Bacteroidales bacterium]